MKRGLFKEYPKLKIKSEYSIWPSFYPTSTFSIRKKFLKKIFLGISPKKYGSIEIDLRLSIYIKFLVNNFKLLNKKLTYYIIDTGGISSKYKKYSKNWWIKRKEAHAYLKNFMKKNELNYSKNVDYFFTELINFFIK